MENLELFLLEEINKLQPYALKTPIDSKNFWKDWQKVFTSVRFAQIAIRSLLEVENLPEPEEIYLNRKLKVLKEVENYLKELREIALQIKGFSIFSPEESEEGNEGDDLDDFLF